MLTSLAHEKIKSLVGFTSDEYNILKLSNDWNKEYRKVLNLYRFHEDRYIEINNLLLILGELLASFRANTREI